MLTRRLPRTANGSSWAGHEAQRKFQHIFAVACVVCAFALTGCGTSLARSAPGHRAAVTPTPQVTPHAEIPWHTVTLPSGVNLSQTTSGFTFSPGNGRTAWLCALTQPGMATVWATQDAGISWQQMSTLTPATPETPTGCTLSPDQGDGHALVATFSWGCGECGTLGSISTFSPDGGAHWRQLAGQMFVLKITQAGATTYAVLSDTSSSAQVSERPQLVASTDTLHTWRRITPPGLRASDSIANYWLSPQTGELLVLSALGTLWRSVNGGQSWSSLQVAPGLFRRTCDRGIA